MSQMKLWTQEELEFTYANADNIPAIMNFTGRSIQAVTSQLIYKGIHKRKRKYKIKKRFTESELILAKCLKDPIIIAKKLNRDLGTVQQWMKKIGIYKGKRLHYTELEINIIKENLEDIGNAAKLLDRDRTAIQQFVRRNNLSYTKKKQIWNPETCDKLWKENEVNFLKNNYKMFSNKMIAEMLTELSENKGRYKKFNANSIAHKASRLKLKKR